MTKKELKKEIKRLRRFKLKCRSGSPERISLHRKIKELQEKLGDITIIDKDKEPLIQEVYRLDPLIKELGMDLTHYTIKQLEFHIKKLNKLVK
jgi:hypothetical protein